MYYSVRHLTKFLYKSPVSESTMETRMHPRSDNGQRCLTFHLSVSPRCRVFSYRDHLGNHIHHFDIPGQHHQLVIVAESLVEVQPIPALPAMLAASDWAELDRLVAEEDFWEMLLPSRFAAFTPAVEKLADELGLQRGDDPLSVLRNLNRRMYEGFEYRPKSTRVDSPIGHAIETRAGVCQDFSHIMLALVRSRLRIPCRYVSGYLCHNKRATTQEQNFTVVNGPETDASGKGLLTEPMPAGTEHTSASSSTLAPESNPYDRSDAAATHAWVECFLPELGWIGFDPTNDLIAGERHIRTAIGRDYADVPPTHGVFRGKTKSELTVAVRVEPSEGIPDLDRELPVPEDWSIIVERAQAVPSIPTPSPRSLQQAQQQQ